MSLSNINLFGCFRFYSSYLFELTCLEIYPFCQIVKFILVHFSKYPLLILWISVIPKILISTFSSFLLFTRFFSLFYGENKYEYGIVNLVFLGKFQVLLFIYSFIHMCIHCLGHLSPLLPIPLLSLHNPVTSRHNLFCPLF
jgi:hypothetical protein